MNKKIKTIIAAGLSTFVIATSIPNKINADTLRLGAAPMYFNNINIVKGQSAEETLEIANTSEFSAAEGQTGINKYTYKVHLDPVEKDYTKYKGLDDVDKNTAMASKWINVEQNDFNLAPNQDIKIKFKITIPEKATIGEHLAILRVKEMPTNSKQINVSSALDIPIFIAVEDPVTKSAGLVKSYKIEKLSLSDKLEKATIGSFIKDIFKLDLNELLYEPLKFTYNSNGKAKTVYDIPHVKKAYMYETVTNDKSKISDTHYIYVPKDLNYSDPIDTINFDNNKMIVVSGGKNHTIVTPSVNVCNDIKNQITNIASKLKNKPTFNFISSAVIVNKSKYQSAQNLYITYDIKNTGTETLIPQGRLTVNNKNDNNKAIYKTLYSSAIIQPGKTKKLIGIFDYTNNCNYRDNANLTIDSNITPYSGAKNIILKDSIKIVHIRMYIIFVVIAILAAIVIAVILGVIKIIKLCKKNKTSLDQNE